MEESILNSVKKMIGIDPNMPAFDSELIIHINTVFAILNQIGAGPVFSIADATSTWESYLGDATNLELIKSYVAAKVRTFFDNPTNGTVSQALREVIAELEWRISVEVDPGDRP